MNILAVAFIPRNKPKSRSRIRLEDRVHGESAEKLYEIPSCHDQCNPHKSISAASFLVDSLMMSRDVSFALKHGYEKPRRARQIALARSGSYGVRHDF